MHSSDANNHVNSNVLRRITYVTCQTSHTYNTLSVLFRNLLPSSCVSPRSAHYWQHYYNQHYIKGIILFMSNKVYVPHLSTAGWMCQSYVSPLSISFCRGTGMIASSSTFRPHLGRVIRDLFRLLDAVYCIVRKH